MQTDFFFVLGGEDNEMSEIKKVLDQASQPYIQPQLQWGKIIVPASLFPQSAANKQVVYVECQPQDDHPGSMIIDHHNHLCDNESSLIQVLQLLKQTPTHKQQLIASIDRDFLYHTIKKYPESEAEIIEIWESGYQKNFSDLTQYKKFRQECESLIDQAIKPYPNLLIIYQTPQSMTLLAALCNLKQLACVLIVGSQDSEDLKPCFYQGPRSVIKKLSSANWQRPYWGRRYFGCRAVPVQFVTYVTQIYASQQKSKSSL